MAAWNPLASYTPAQQDQLAAFETLLCGYNRKVNLIARDTEAYFQVRHVRHCLALAQHDFLPGSLVVDWGSGGGLPAIPLAIRFPEVQFVAVDAVGKKMGIVQAMARRLGLHNLTVWHGRAEAWPGTAVYSVSRAAAPLETLWRWHLRVAHPVDPSAHPQAWPPGLLCLKGGDLTQEIADLRQAFPAVAVSSTPLFPLLGDPYFAHKLLVQVQA